MKKNKIVKKIIRIIEKYRNKINNYNNHYHLSNKFEYFQ